MSSHFVQCWDDVLRADEVQEDEVNGVWETCSRKGGIRLDVVGLRVKGNLGMRCVIAVGTEVISGNITGSQGRRLAVAKVACQGLGARAECVLGVCVGFIRSSAGVRRDEGRVEAEVSG